MAGPFGMSLGGSHLFQHHLGSGAVQRTSQQQQRARNIRKLTAAAAAATAGAAGVQLYRTGRLAPLLPQRPAAKGSQPLLQIPRELADVICGAFGEIVQVAILYPLDTIKVRCQAGGLPVKSVVQQLMGPGSSPAGALRQLYAGVVSASLASVVVGSLYYFTFCAAKRAATKMVAKSEHAQAASTAAAAAAAGAAGLSINTRSSSSSGGNSNPGTPHAYPHGSGADCHGFDAVFAAICSDDKAAAAAAHQQHHQQAPAAALAAVSTTPSTSSNTTSSTSSSSQPPELSSHGKLQANILAACAAAVVGALVEAPVELFKHRAQAGQIQGSMVAAVASALKQHGPAALYGSFFIPFLFKSLPFDIGELMTYSSLNDWRAAAVVQAKAAAPTAAPAAAPAAAAVSSAPSLSAAAESSAAVATPSLAASSSSSGSSSQGMPALASLTAASLSNSSSSGGLLSPAEFVSNMPDHAWDMAVGAAAGAAAVLISMPPDCIKTVMETGGGVQASGNGWGPLRSASAFAGTGRQLVAQHGARGLFMGLAPRLAESVPSTALYWICVEACRRMLEPYVAPEAGSAAAAVAPAGSSSSS